MNEMLNKAIVLVLNRNWQAINVRTPKDAFCQMATNVATGLDIDGDAIRPVKWDEWINLPVRECDLAARTVDREVRVPTVVIAVNYARVPMKRPAFSARSIRLRDGDRCQYSGRMLRPHEGSVDHIVPRARGGRDSWENCVWACRELNNRKADRLPHEAGLTLIREPSVPRPLPVSALIRNAHDIPEWEMFLDA